MSEAEGRAITEFWKGLWQVAGCHTPGYSALVEWGRRVRRAVREAGKTEGPTRSQAWSAAVSEQPNWKAPGPDGVAAFWWKVFEGMTKRMEEAVWEAIDGDGDVPSWL